jgi:hypothetical protein
VTRTIASLAIGLMTCCAGAAHAQDVIQDEPSEAVKACITTNAPAVERAFASLNEGVDFLTTKLCAAELSDQIVGWSEKRARTLEEQQRAWIKEMCDARSEEDASTDNPRAAALLGMSCDDEDGAALSMFGGASVYMTPWLTTSNLPKATSLAARTLLELRSKHAAQKP